MTVEQLLAESRKLTREERARFALALVREFEDVNGDGDDADAIAVHEAWTRELRKRMDEVRTRAVTPLTLDQFRQRVRERREALSR